MLTNGMGLSPCDGLIESETHVTGGAKASNSDPYAMKATSDNQWAHHPPHMMIVVPDLKSLDGISTDPANGGPYVMFKGTPYAHIMAPTAPGMMHGH